MYQGGINKITLFEKNNISFYHFDPANELNITNIETESAIIAVENKQLPTFEHKDTLSRQGQVIQEFEISFFLLDYNRENLQIRKTLLESIYGWAILIEFYDGTYKFYNSAFKCESSEMKPQEEFAFSISMNSPVDTDKEILDYTPDVSILPIYRADTTELTADTDIYTADYAQ